MLENMKRVKLSEIERFKLYVINYGGTFRGLGSFWKIEDDEFIIHTRGGGEINCCSYYMNDESLEVFEYTPIRFLGMPFAYNGPCATILGCGKIYNKRKTGNSSFWINEDEKLLDLTLITPRFDQSPADYLENAFLSFSKSGADRTIVMGGNHLSALPLHRYAHDAGLFTIILDAHRDYSTNGLVEDYTHANFLSYFDDLSNVMIVGFRDSKKKPEPYKNCQLVSHDSIGRSNFYKYISDLKKNGKKFYVDIDLDVLDPSCFQATDNPIEGGLRPAELLSLLETIGFENIQCISIEEYNPYLESKDHQCLDIINDIIECAITGWNGCLNVEDLKSFHSTSPNANSFDYEQYAWQQD